MIYYYEFEWKRSGHVGIVSKNACLKMERVYLEVLVIHLQPQQASGLGGPLLRMAKRAKTQKHIELQLLN